MKVLVADNNLDSVKEMVAFIKEQGHEVTPTTNGKDTQLAIYNQKFEALILDSAIQSNNAFEVIRYVKSRSPGLKIIFICQNRNEIQEWGLSIKDMHSLGVSEVLNKPIQFNKFQKALNGITQYSPWLDETPTKQNQSLSEESITMNDDLFTKLPLRNFIQGSRTVFDHYIRIGKNKYVKILHKGESFNRDRLLRYINEGLENLYFKTQDRGRYISYVNHVLKRLASRNTSSATKVRTYAMAASLFVEEIYTNGLRPEAIESGNEMAQNAFQALKRIPYLAKILDECLKSKPDTQTHLFLTSFLTVIICNHLPYAGSKTSRIAIMGALLHDIGMLKMPAHIRSLREEEMSEKQREQYNTHPTIGFRLLDSTPHIEEGIKQIVYHHHERIDGSGFPQGLTGAKIYPLAKVVGFADELADYLVHHQKGAHEGIKAFMADDMRWSKHDGQIIRAFLEALSEKIELRQSA